MWLALVGANCNTFLAKWNVILDMSSELGLGLLH